MGNEAAVVTAADAGSGDNNNSEKQQKQWKKVLWFVLGQWLLIGIGVVCVLAYFFPSVAKSGGVLRAQYSILYGAIAVIFLVSGLSIPRDKLVVHMLDWRLHAVVQGTSYVVVPAIMTGLVRAVVAGDRGGVIDRAVLAGYVLTACIPTTIASNVVMTRSAGGDEAAALAEVLVGNVLGPFISPAWTVTLLPRGRSEADAAAFAVFRGEGDLSLMYRAVFKHLGLSMLLPLAVGLAVRWRWAAPTARVLQRFSVGKVSTFCLLLVIWSTFSTCFATRALQALSGGCVAFVVLFNVALYLFLSAVAFAVARVPGLDRLRAAPVGRHLVHRFDARTTIAICFCAPAKTTALGMPLLFSMWAAVPAVQQAKASVPVLLYTTEQVFVAHFLVHLFRRWLARENAKLGESEEELHVSDASRLA